MKHVNVFTNPHNVEFGQLIGKRGIPRHYTIQDLEDDIEYATKKRNAANDNIPFMNK